MRNLLSILADAVLINSTFAAAEFPQRKSVFIKLKVGHPQTAIVYGTRFGADGVLTDW